MKTNKKVGAKIKHCVILSVEKRKYSPTVYTCQCSCGNVFKVTAALLNNAKWKGHCGCLPHANVVKQLGKRRKELTDLQKTNIRLKDFMNEVKQGEYDVRQTESI